MDEIFYRSYFQLCVLCFFALKNEKVIFIKPQSGKERKGLLLMKCKLVAHICVIQE
jgi:hypothetical protein